MPHPFNVPAAGSEIWDVPLNENWTKLKALFNVHYVGGGITDWSGADIGAQINAAYAALPSTGGTIIVLPQSDGSAYQFSTPIVFNVAGKPCMLCGMGPAGSPNAGINAGTILEYLPESATTAITFDCTSTTGSATVGIGMRNIALWNNALSTSSLATGVKIGPTNGGLGFGIFDLVNIEGFGVGFDGSAADDVSWGIAVRNCLFAGNTLACKGVAAEGMSFINTRFVNNTSHFTTTGGDTYFTNCSFDGHGNGGYCCFINFTGVSQGGFVEFIGCHFETFVGSHTHFITGDGNWKIIGGMMVDNITAGTPDYYFRAAGGFAVVEGLVVIGARVATQIVNAVTPVRARVNLILSGTIFSSPPVTPAYANATYCAFPSNNSNPAGTETLEGALKVNGNIGFYGHATAAKPTVTGSRNSNAALTSLLTALAGLGLLTDSSS